MPVAGGVPVSTLWRPLMPTELSLVFDAVGIHSLAATSGAVIARALWLGVVWCAQKTGSIQSCPHDHNRVLVRGYD